MSILDVIEFGIAAGIFTAGFGFAGLYLLRKRLVGAVLAVADGYLTALIADFTENPDKLAPLLNNAANLMMKKFGVTEGEQSGGDLKIGRFKIPGWLVQAGMQMLTKNGGQAVKEVAKEALDNPFG